MTSDNNFLNLFLKYALKPDSKMLNKKIKSAIEAAVAQEGQPAELATKLVSWLEQLMDGNEDIADSEAYTRRTGICFDATVVNTDINE
jgi:hypothetical protein